MINDQIAFALTVAIVRASDEFHFLTNQRVRSTRSQLSKSITRVRVVQFWSFARNKLRNIFTCTPWSSFRSSVVRCFAKLQSPSKFFCSCTHRTGPTWSVAYHHHHIRLLQGAAKNIPPSLQKSDYFQNNLIFLVNFSEVIRETFCH